jgi:hypothetical protein
LTKAVERSRASGGVSTRWMQDMRDIKRERERERERERREMYGYGRKRSVAIVTEREIHANRSRGEGGESDAESYIYCCAAYAVLVLCVSIDVEACANSRHRIYCRSAKSLFCEIRLYVGEAETRSPAGLAFARSHFESLQLSFTWMSNSH